MKEAFIITAVAGTFAPLIPLTIYWRTRKYQESYMKLLALLLIGSFLCDTLGMVSSLWLKKPYLNFVAMNAYFFIVIVCLTLFYRTLFPVKFQAIFFAVLAILSIVYIYHFFTQENLGTHDRYVPQHVVFTLIALLYFYQLTVRMPMMSLESMPMFWINTGFLLYFAGTIVDYVRLPRTGVER